MIDEYDDSAENFATFLMNYNDNDDVFYDDCFKPNVLLQWQNISSEFCRQPVTQPRRFFGGSKSKPVDPLRFQFECICAGDLSVIGFSWIQQGRIYMRSKTVVVGVDLKSVMMCLMIPYSLY